MMKSNILAINAGSSTVKFQLINMYSNECIVNGIIENVGENLVCFKINTPETKIVMDNIQLEGTSGITKIIFDKLNAYVDKTLNLAGVVHRVAHGGELFKNSVFIDEKVLFAIEKNNNLAPLHNPINVAFIKSVMNFLDDIPQVAVFDTAFHQTIKPIHYIYSIPYHYYENDHIRRYGFHGMSHKYVLNSFIEQCNQSAENSKIISCHLGNGSSICAIENGKSINTSMGFTPLSGIMMGTRCGDIDPAILGFIAQKHNKTAQEVDDILYKESGLLGISELSNDCRVLLKAKKEGNEKATLAIDIFCERIRHFIGAYWIQMGGCDAIIFTGGIGENSPEIRNKICQGLENIGIVIDSHKNEQSLTLFQAKKSTIKLSVIKTNEELMMAKEAFELINSELDLYLIKRKSDQLNIC